MALFGPAPDQFRDYENLKNWNDALEKAAQIAERETILDAMHGVVGVRPYGKEIANEIRALKQ